jgi:hypothetical protein
MRAAFARRLGRAPQILVIGCLCAAAIAGCGGSSSTPTATPTASSNVGWAPSKLTSETPHQILRKSAAALEKAGAFRMQGTLHQLSAPQKWMRMSAALYSAQRFELSVTQSRGGMAMIVDRAKAYFRADDTFWVNETHNSRAATLLGNRWFTYPGAKVRQIDKSMGNFTPSKLSKCLVVATGEGSLSDGGYTTVDNQRAIVLRAPAEGPGGQAAEIAVAMYGPPYPLEIKAYGKQLPGKAKGGGACGAGSSGPAWVGGVTLSGFGQLPKLQVPTHATSVQQYAQRLSSRPAV